MKPFAQSLREDRRLVLLRLLSEQPGYRANSSNLHAGLYALGVAGSRDDVATDIAWLSEQALVNRDEVPEVPGLAVVSLTARGCDVAQGHAIVPGVSRPAPR